LFEGGDKSASRVSKELWFAGSRELVRQARGGQAVQAGGRPAACSLLPLDAYTWTFSTGTFAMSWGAGHSVRRICKELGEMICRE
jgi:hypothetical protein